MIFMDGLIVGSFLRDTLVADRYDDPEGPMAARRQYGHAIAAQIDIYRKLRPGDIPEPKEATKLFENLFFNAERYDLSRVGRLKLNYKFYKDRPTTSSPRSTSGADQGRHPSHGQAPHRAQERPRHGRRHRPPR